LRVSLPHLYPPPPKGGGGFGENILPLEEGDVPLLSSPSKRGRIKKGISFFSPL